jgi:hypothetical protein
MPISMFAPVVTPFFSKIIVKRYLYDNFRGLFIKYFCILYANINVCACLTPMFSKIMVKNIYKFNFRGLFMPNFCIIYVSINGCDCGYKNFLK